MATNMMRGANSAETSMLDGHEQVVLAAMMNGHAALPVHEYDFASPPNRTIFQTIKQSKALGLLAVQAELGRRGKLAEVDGPARLIQICCLPTDNANVQFALSQVLDASRSRRAADIGGRLNKGAITYEDAIAELNVLKAETMHKPEKSWEDALSESAVTSTELRSLELMPRKKLFADWFCEGDCGFPYAFRGVGKTWFALAIAQALATGGKLGDWQASEPVKVLYVDSEMPADLMRERSVGLGTDDNFQILNHELLFERTGKILNIAEPEIQNAITKHCVNKGVRVLFIDNLSTAAFGLKENEADSWERMLPWLLNLRRHKIAVVIVHHAGRSGEMRGTTKREDSVFWIIALEDVKKNADDKRGAHFVSQFTKPSRNTQDELGAVEWHFVTELNGQVTIAHKSADTLEIFRSVIESGVTRCEEIADAMKIRPYVVSRMAKKAMDAGWLKKSGRDYELVKTEK